MKSLSFVKTISIMALIAVLSGCGGGGGGPDNPDPDPEPNPNSQGSKWDEMKWDQGNWS